MKKLCTGILLLLFLVSCSMQNGFASPVSVNLNGKPIAFDQAPFVENGRVLVPIRGILESLGYTVQWQSHTRSVLAMNEGTTISLPLESQTVTVNNQKIKIDVPAKLQEGCTFVPLRFLAEYSGAEVYWDKKSSTVSIYSAQKQEMTAKDSVVFIQTNKTQGSGIILSEDGLIATNFHVIEHASTAQIILNNGEIYQGAITVIGLHPESDIALLKIEKNDLLPAKITTDYAIKDVVTSIGSPNGQRNRESSGVIQSFDQDFICSTAYIAEGSSGGGLFDTSGRLLGMTTLSAGEQKYCSIPISQVLETKQNLSFPIEKMKDYTYLPHAPKNLRYHTESGQHSVSWSPVYGADYYTITISSEDGNSHRIMKNTNGSEKWYWGYPACMVFAAEEPLQIKVTAVVDGIPTAESDPLNIP